MEILSVAYGDLLFGACWDIRFTVFVQEQNVPLEHERDEHDAAALHVLARADGAALGTARVVFKDAGMTAKIGRVAVLQAARGQGIGAALIRFIEQHPAVRDVRVFALDAQSQALRFYENLGYAAASEVFMEAGIPHVHMQKLRVR